MGTPGWDGWSEQRIKTGIGGRAPRRAAGENESPTGSCLADRNSSASKTQVAPGLRARGLAESAKSILSHPGSGGGVPAGVTRHNLAVTPGWDFELASPRRDG